MNPRLLALLMRRFRNSDPDDQGGGGKVDRGDDFTPTDDDEDPPKGGEAKTDDKPDLKDGGKGGESEKKGGNDDPDDDTDDETDEEKAAREAEEAKAKGAGGEKGTKKDTRIPLNRHKEILERERAQRAAVERELEGFRKGAVVTATNEDITKLEDDTAKLESDYNKQLADGELEKATATMRQIRKNEREINDKRNAATIQAAEARAYERVRYDTIVDRLEAAYPQLVKDHADYDADKVNEILELKDALQLKGYTPADAVQRATRLVFGVETTRQEKATTTDVKVDKVDVAKATAEERKKEAVERNVKVAGKQPAELSKVGLDNDKLGGSLTARDAVKLPYDEFKKLDENTLAKMRGDVVA